MMSVECPKLLCVLFSLPLGGVGGGLLVVLNGELYFGCEGLNEGMIETRGQGEPLFRRGVISAVEGLETRDGDVTCLDDMGMVAVGGGEEMQLVAK